MHWFDGGDKKLFTEEQKKSWAARKKAAEMRQLEGWQKAALTAQNLVRETEVKEHNYLHMKGLGQTLGLVDVDGALIVPMRDALNNSLQGVQRIKWDEQERRYDKKMLFGMRAKGAVLRIGSQRAQEAIFCEGYATGLSIELATRQMRLNAAVIVCFSDKNMVHASNMIKTRGYCFADNDKSGAGERAARDTGRTYCMPNTEGYDANDMHKNGGLMAVCEMIMKARKIVYS
jgi:putative DNA primase/helicase